MTALTILGVLAALGALGGGAWAVNTYAQRTYGYNAFRVPNLAFMLVPFALFWTGYAFVEEGQTLAQALLGGNLNTILMVAVAGLSLVGFAVYLAKKTNIWIALAATAIQFAAAVAIIAVVVLAVVLKDWLTPRKAAQLRNR